MFTWTVKGPVWPSSDALVDMEANGSERRRSEDETFSARVSHSGEHRASKHSGQPSAQLGPRATEASNRIIIFAFINAALQILGYIMSGWKLLDVAQRIQTTQPPSNLSYLVDVICMVTAGNGFMVWLHLLILAYLREERGGRNGLHGSGSASTLPTLNRGGWEYVKYLLKVKGKAFMSSIRVHICFAILFETAWTLFLLVDGWAFVHFGLHIISTTVLHMLMNPEWFLGMAHIDFFKAMQGLFGLSIFTGIQAGVFFLCGLLPPRFPEMTKALQSVHRSIASSKRVLWAVPAVYIIITSLYLATPLPYQDVAVTALPVNYAALVGSFRSGNHESFDQPYINVNKIGIYDKKLQSLHPNLYPQLKHKKNILMLLGDSLRTDWYKTPHSAQTRDFLSKPHVNYSCSTFLEHYTNGHTTEGGMFSMMYSLWPELNTVKRMELIGPAASFPLSLLKANGYVLYGFKTGVLGYSYILRHESKAFFGVNQYNYHQDFPSSNDEQVVDRVLEWRKNRLLYQKMRKNDDLSFEGYTSEQRKKIEKDAEGEYYFTVVFLSRAHALAHSTKDPSQYWAATKTYDDNFKRVLDAFKPEIDDGSTALIFSSDHAEMLGENGYYGHGWNSIEQFWRRELLGIPLSLCLPNHPNKRKIWPSSDELNMHVSHLPHPTSSVDLFPTMLEYLQMDPPLSASLFSDGKSFFPSSSPSTIPSAFSFSDADDDENRCGVINVEQVVAFDNLNGPIDRVALVRKNTLSTTTYNLNDCLLFSQAYHTRSCKHSQTIVSLYNLSNAELLTTENAPQPYAERLECMRQTVYRYLSHPLPQLLAAGEVRLAPDEKKCLAVGKSKELEAQKCNTQRAQQLWMPSQKGEMVSVYMPYCRVIPSSPSLEMRTLDAYRLACQEDVKAKTSLNL